MKKTLWLKNELVLPYAEFVKQVNDFCWRNTSDQELKEQLRFCSLQAVSLGTAKLYSILKEIVFRCMGITLFDSQLAAAYSMQCGRIAELPTGEGKTLAAVLAAICFALQGKSVHILVFNDYLAKRDCISNQSIFNFCGLSSSYIDQTTKSPERKKAYGCNIVYLSAKEAGFDFLRDFLCTKKEDLLFPGFQVAIVDEADSILIDESRIPLVLAGDAPKSQTHAVHIHNAVSTLSQKDISIEKSKNQVWLTDLGIAHIEQFLHLENLYSEENANILGMVSATLEARLLLKKDKDYIVKDNAIQVIDESTGRVAVNRKFPDLLHHAVEVKEQITGESCTMVYNSMTLQSFLLQYKILCGMTGTIYSSAKELKSMYGLEADVIPPHIPCIRIDHEDEIFNNKKGKIKAIVSEIQRAYEKGQPVLLGTQSVEESEEYSELLTAQNIPHSIINARNDEREAEIISRAGEPYRITVSTNMAGRGVDIKLGGKDEERKDFVRTVGGLYVLSTGINRSIRIDNQLRGRAGRQGDPGESKFFISMEDSLLTTYFSDDELIEIQNNVNIYNKKRLSKLVRRVQKREEGKDAEARYMLERYAYILEQQRNLIASYRTEILLEELELTTFQEQEPDIYQKYVETAGKRGVKCAESQLTLYYINQHWADFLMTMENVRNGIHLMIIGGKSPLDEYHRISIAAFDEMIEDIKKDVISSMKKYKITSDGIDMEEAGLSGATTTWTYMIDESNSQFRRIPQLMKTVSNTINGTVFTLQQIFSKFKKK